MRRQNAGIDDGHGDAGGARLQIPRTRQVDRGVVPLGRVERIVGHRERLPQVVGFRDLDGGIPRQRLQRQQRLPLPSLSRGAETPSRSDPCRGRDARFGISPEFDQHRAVARTGSDGKAVGADAVVRRQRRRIRFGWLHAHDRLAGHEVGGEPVGGFARRARRLTDHEVVIRGAGERVHVDEIGPGRRGLDRLHGAAADRRIDGCSGFVDQVEVQIRDGVVGDSQADRGAGRQADLEVVVDVAGDPRTARAACARRVDVATHRDGRWDRLRRGRGIVRCERRARVVGIRVREFAARRCQRAGQVVKRRR